VSPNQLYFLDCCRSKIIPSKIIDEFAEKTKCITMGYILENGQLTSPALEMLNEFETFLVKTKKKITSEVLGVNFIQRVDEYREIFPKGKFPSGELARQNIQELKDKFVWFFKTYPEYSWDVILDATDYYLFVKEKMAFQYAICSSYFIKKTDKYSKEIKSALADYCQMIVEDPELLNVK